MAGVIQASFSTILARCKTQMASYLVTDLLLTSDQATNAVKIVSRDESRVPKLVGDRDVLIRPLQFVSHAPGFDGAGRTCLRFIRYLDVIPRVRMHLDNPDSDEVFLIGSGEQGTEAPEVGFIGWEESCACALAGFIPTEDGTVNGNWLVQEPIRVFDGDLPDKNRTTKGWGGSGIRFEVVYLKLHHQPEL